MTPVTHRDQLISMLAEAAEIEHCLMCSYLYAAFSLKRGADEDLLPEELAAVKRWRAEVIAIATEEMLHLALVNNLLIAVGARPHYRHYNFPANVGQFPADLAVALLPFDEATLDHFIYVERPSQSDEEDGGIIEKPDYSRDLARTDLVTDIPCDYETVGELYDAIGAGVAYLAAEMGEANLFVGQPQAQLTERDVFLPGLCSIGSAADAVRALALIVEQGEGSVVCKDTSHYARFRTIREQWRALAEKRPAFKPYRNAARHPVMRTPVDREQRLQVISEPAILLLDIGNASYFLMLRILALMSDTVNCLLPRPVVMGQAMGLMHALADIGTALTLLPANPAHPDVTAGLTFTLSRTALGYESPDSAARLIAERMELLADHAETGAAALPAMTRFAQALREGATAWRQAHDSKAAQVAQLAQLAQQVQEQEVRDTDVQSAPDAQGEPGAEPQAAPQVEIARGATGTVYFEASRCVHSRHCVLEEPEVFKANQPGEWIFPDKATPERLGRVARRCVSGAIRYERHDGLDPETAPPVNLVRVREAGPLALNADIRIVAADGSTGAALRATLCRCGQSKNKPYCDQSHIAAGFDASGEAPTRPSSELEFRDGPLQVTPLRDGPLDVRGAAEVITGTGRTVDRSFGVRLCRCGQSGDKPFCDGSHRAAGFSADGCGV